MERDGVAIIGMACLFPGAPDLNTFWHNVVTKVDAVTDPPPGSWDSAVFFDPASEANDRVYCKRGGFISSLAYFDPIAHGIMPKTVAGGEPDQWLALQIARSALADAGYADDIPERRRTAVVIGKGTYLNGGNLTAVQHGIVADQTLHVLKTLHPEFTEDDLQAIRHELKQRLPPFNADTASGLIPNIIAGRIANRLDLMGPSYTVDAACASSLIALDIGVRELLAGRCDLALVGGSHVVTPVPVLMLFCQLGALSRQQRIRPFDKDADGTILGEGIGMAVLKRLADAERDGNRIYAVVKGIGTSSDGRGLSVMAPRLEGQVEAMQRAYESAGIAPGTVGLIEAHGTATSIGDATEVKALTQVFGARDGALPRIALGSVKSMISHLMPAAGIAALIKTALALYHRVLPPTLNVDAPNPELHLEQTSFYINSETRPWIHAAADTPRRAGVSAFGFGGINAHVILEEYRAPSTQRFQSRQLHWDTELCIVSAASRPELIERIRALGGFLEGQEPANLKDLAYTLSRHLEAAPYRLAVVASSAADLRQKLAWSAQRLSDPACQRIKDAQGVYFFDPGARLDGRLAFMFAGEGSQYVNMLADLCIHFPEVRQQFDLVDRVFAGSGRVYLPSDAVFPRPAFSEPERKAAEERIWQMEGAVEAVLIANRALCRLLGRLGIRPDALVGHSTGDYSAMAAAGMIDLNDEEHVSAFALELNAIYRMGAESGEITPTALFAVGGPAQAVREALGQAGDDVHVVMDNCPHQTVIAGPEGNIATWVEELTRQGLICERLPWDRPYHSPGFEAYARRLEPLLARWITAPPSTPVYSCMTMSRYPDDPGEAQRAAYQHWLRPVEFGKTIEAMYSDGVRIFVEVSAGGKLASFVDDILRGQPHLAVAANVKSRPGITQLNHLVGALAAHGVPVNLDPLYASRAPRAVPLTQAEAAGADHKPSTRMKLATGWPPMSLSEEFAAQLRGKHAAQSAPPAAKAREALAAEPSLPTRAEHPTLEPAATSKVTVSYLQTMDQFLAVQGEVMQAFLTGRALAPASGLPTGGSADVLAASAGDLGISELSRPPTVPGNGPPLEEVAADAAVESLAPAASTHSAEARALDADALCAILLRLVSERTGYPTEMLDLDLDLEANLGIDSIKRVEILGTLQKQTGLVRAADMEALAGRKTLREIIAVLAALASAPALPEGAAAATEPERTPAPSSVVERPLLPFIDTVTSHVKGQEVLARVELSLDRAPFLRDHTLGRAVSVTDPGLCGLPIVPFTVGMEILAETASLLVPGARLMGMRDVQAHRWMALDTDRLGLEVAARRLSPQSEHAIYACIREAEPSAGRSQTQAVPIIEGVMLFGERLPDAPAAGPFPLAQERPSTWIADRLYEAVMFHGPLFRGVASITRTGDDGVEALLNVRPASDLLGPDQRGALITDPILLDQPGQVVGFWTAEHLNSSYVIFPYRLQELCLYDAPLQAPGQARCRARVELLGDWQVRSDLDVLGPDDRLAARFVGWEDRRFDLPGTLFGFLLAPAATVLSQPWPALLRLAEANTPAQAFGASVDAFPQGFFTAHGGIWQRVLAYSILSRRERELWADLSVPEGRRIEWLLGRLAAKDAVRCAVKQRFDITLAPADIEILPDRHGRPVVAGAWLERAGGAFQVSLAHTAGTAVAVAVAQAAGIGVDIEHIAHLRAGIGEVAFTAGERALLGTGALAAPGDGLLRLWCAKEAAAKAIGRGMLGGPQSLEARAFDPARGTVEIALRGALAEAVPGMNGGPLTVWTAREGDLVMALSLIDSQLIGQAGQGMG